MAASEKDNGDGDDVGTTKVVLWVLGAVVVGLIGYIIFLCGKCKRDLNMAIAEVRRKDADIKMVQVREIRYAREMTEEMINNIRRDLVNAGASTKIQNVFDVAVDNSRF